MSSSSTQRNHRKSDNTVGVIWVTAGTALFTVVFASGKFAGDTASALQILFIRYIGGFATLTAIAIMGGKGLKFYASTKPASHFFRAIFGAFGGASAIYAAANMPIADATTIGLLEAIFTVLLGVLLLGDRISRPHWSAISISCAGAAVMMASKGAFQTVTATYLWPAGIALLGAILIACESIMIKVLAVSEKPMTVLLYVNAFGIVLLSIPAILTWRSTELYDNLQFLLLGPLAITAQYFVIKGFRVADVSVLGPVSYTWIVFAAILGYVLFDETPGVGTIVGAVIIVIGGIKLALLKPTQD
ncbi:DMT family transporter [Pelagibius sp. Alg239-R121]|uniref:DMT family transporter n=1 Tax=Pelagibius sp. Alg239-R121 TaxID=2993448 RepID=UPI0024A71A59|nr:DMT family transporter [Pelagibius sp. Alg239-R121]